MIAIAVAFAHAAGDACATARDIISHHSSGATRRRATRQGETNAARS
jgi:hypothetical protein